MKMKIDILTLFPEFFDTFIQNSIIGRACKKDILDIRATDIRDFSKNKHRKVDDYPYGGGGGMVMQAQPIYDAYKSVSSELSSVVFLTPQGMPLNQIIAEEMSHKKHLILLCGHYEGVDERIIDMIVDYEISIGDYVLTGGEIPAMVFIDCISRMIPGVLSSEQSYLNESHNNGILEYPQYTRPEEFMGRRVPDILLTGHHANINRWRRAKSLERTYLRRPDMFEKIKLSKQESKDLEYFMEENNRKCSNEE